MGISASVMMASKEIHTCEIIVQILMNVIFQTNAMEYAIIMMEDSTVQAAPMEKCMIEQNINVSCQLKSTI